VGLSAGHFAGLSPASFSPAKSPAKGTELEKIAGKNIFTFLLTD